MQPTEFFYVITVSWQASRSTTASSTRSNIITVTGEVTREELFANIVTSTRTRLGIPEDNRTMNVLFFSVEPNALPTVAATEQAERVA